MSDTESFESVMDTLLYGFTHDVRTDELSGSYKMIAARLERLKAAHDREIRDVSQQQYNRGFNDGQHSMDAEHRAIAMRLRALPLDGGSHENLSQIARAVYHADFGWTQGACAALRDELVRLMGGVSDGNLSKSPKTINLDELTTDLNHGNDEKPSITEVGDDTCCCAGGGACAADCGCDSGEQEEVEDGRAAHDCGADSRGGDSGGDLHMVGVSIPDITDELRKFAMTYKNVWRDDSGSIIYTTSDFPPTEDAMSMMNYINEIADNIDARFNWAMISRSSELGCCKLRINQLESERDELRAELEELRGHSRTCPESGDGASESAPSASITDELREWAKIDVWSCGWEEFEAIADRIDEQFDRICWQQEAVLQETIDEMAGEIDKMRKEVIELREQRHNLQVERGDLVYERDELLKQRAEMTAELARRLKERDELQRELRETKLEREDMAAKIAEDANDHAAWQIEIQELRERLDGYDHTHVELPKDANGEPIHVGDVLYSTIDGDTWRGTVSHMLLQDEGWTLGDIGYFADALSHRKPPTIEEIIEKLTLGEITQSEAIERIKSLGQE